MRPLNIILTQQLLLDSQRIDSSGGVEVSLGVAKECLVSAGRVGAAKGVAKSALTPLAVLRLPVVLLKSV